MTPEHSASIFLSRLPVSGRIQQRGFGPSLSLSLPAEHNTNREKGYENTSVHQRRQDYCKVTYTAYYVKRPDL
jgi:hypothetical protein